MTNVVGVEEPEVVFCVRGVECGKEQEVGLVMKVF